MTPTTTQAAVYGPVKSWRLGRSLGIDLLVQSSICSFRCAYCQLGKIELPTAERREWVATARVLADLELSDWRSADVVTFSGNGEPTLATNLGECIRAIRDRTGKPIVVLTNGTLLNDPAVRADLAAADRVYVKLDAASDRGLRMVDNPVEGITLEGCLAGILAFRAEYAGYLAIQTMVMPMNLAEVEPLCDLYTRIKPDEIQLNTPLRPMPRAWYPESRGNHEGPAPVPESHLRVLTREQACEVEQLVREKTGLKVVSVYQPA
ncbi:MAG: radical SAM protein [Candidatus Sericytochromatia bacterium]|nr:radical SAM protein [Candidatus Tanganyikabacteria bacterium]